MGNGLHQQQIAAYIAQIAKYSEDARAPMMTAASWPHAANASASTQNIANALEVITSALAVLSMEIAALKNKEPPHD